MEQTPKDLSIEPHLRYIGITAGEVEALRIFKPVVEANAAVFVDRFYAHLLNFSGTRAFLKDENVIRRLLKAQRDYLLSLFDGKLDDAHLRHRRLIGQTHFRIGLDFQWYIGAYVLYLDFLIPLAHATYAADRPKLTLLECGIRKAVLLDMTIVLEAYHEGDKAALAESQAKVMHQERLAAIGLLSSGLAHEIGNPLASIMAICDNQLRKEEDPKIRERFERIRQQTLRVTNIVRQLVNFARPSAANIHVLNLNEVIESALGIARLARTSKTAEIDLRLDPALPQVHGMSDQLAQVFLNLFLNAFDAIHENGGKLQIRSLVDRGCVLVEIEDNGQGISETDLERIFNPFFTTKQPGKGTGLGLHVSSEIMQRHRGEIRVRSIVGQGSTFTVVLPLSNVPSEGKPS